ncbi:hypothetical protein A2803_04525 [Candidatus Woesebacteria bacterium RIFCSPHIGHO2_01_FULL_44_21]|uniref:DUF2292 domain-containing protein n=1 Tax=Candidatus Woesebacteria bacterium RIFCSPHIGHO2_01_FULL_44_21 TaxID=1802503 RepID=A0A1F7YWE2_9BACT|nr:MAG: hypothetical protein A2803_04525 [Candidatus Woesebacteria bacterium RIFCSPHIGHO2_01_FULL_44_21]OGM71337.1 MAG: hypothetical protein A2897_00890 [Candidatus Woesebacteria bacterium RIFCSPLOWO2_01_FULL_44_24b]
MDTGQEYSVKRISETLVAEIKKSLKGVHGFGSVEIFVQNGVVTQITVRNIKKTGNIPRHVGRA